MRHFVSDRRGGVSILFAAGLPMMLGLAAFAVDLGSASLESRKLQGIADAAALAAAGDPGHAQQLAQAAVDASGWPRAITVTATAGSYARDLNVPMDRRFTSSGSGDAVRVSLQTASPTFFARIFGQQSIALSRHATAARERMAGFSIGSRLAALNGGLVNAYLSALTGSSVSLTVMDYNGLAGADVDLFGFLSALRTTAHLDAVTFNDVLNAQVTRSQALEALAAALDASNPTQAAAMRKMAAEVGGGNLSLAALIDPGALGTQASGGTGIARVNTLAMVTAMLQLAAPSRQVSLDLGAGIAGLASTRVTIAIGERPANSPWVTVTDNGEPIIRTAQARIYADTQLANVSLPGIGTLVGIRLPLYVELASAQARLTGIDCSTAASRGVTIEAQPGLGTAAIASLDPSKLGDFSNAMTLSDARLVDTLLVDVDGRADIDLGSAEAWQSLNFDQAAITNGTIQTVSSGSAVTGIAQSLATKTSLSVKVIGLPIPLDPLVKAVGSQLALAAPAIDGLLDVATGTLGVHYGQADVRVTGMRCGTAALVA